MEKKNRLVTFMALTAAVALVSCLSKPAANMSVINAPPLEGTIWKLSDRRNIWYQKFFPGGVLFLVDETVYSNTWQQNGAKIAFSVNDGELSYEGEFVDANVISGKVRNTRGEIWDFGLTLVNDPAITARFAHRDTWESDSVFPPFTASLKGTSEVRISNPNSSSLTALVRNSGGEGIEFDVAAKGYNSVFIPNGDYEIYFTFSWKHGILYRGDDFSLTDKGFEIKIAYADDGNYTIRQVEEQ